MLLDEDDSESFTYSPVDKLRNESFQINHYYFNLPFLENFLPNWMLFFWLFIVNLDFIHIICQCQADRLCWLHCSLHSCCFDCFHLPICWILYLCRHLARPWTRLFTLTTLCGRFCFASYQPFFWWSSWPSRPHCTTHAAFWTTYVWWGARSRTRGWELPARSVPPSIS